MDILYNEIHLWITYYNKINDSQLISDYHSLLNEHERNQLKRFYFERHQHQYLVTRALVRTTLSSYLPEIKPRNWEFYQNEFGKPYIKNTGLSVNLYFNISHAENMIVFAISTNPVIGVDVESIHRDGNVMEIASNNFTNDEFSLLKGKPVEMQREFFFNLWTLKEAYIKAMGKGLSIPLKQFSFGKSFKDKISIQFIPDYLDNPSHWQFFQLKPDDIHIIALAARSASTKLRYSILMREVTPRLHL